MEIYIEQLKTFSNEDLTSINKLLKQLDDTSTPLTKAHVEDMIASSPTHLFVARQMDDKKIIGMLIIVFLRIASAKKGLMEDIVVDKAHRGKGIGKKLIKTAITKARKEEVYYLDFTSRPSRAEANKLYESLGFKKRETNVYRIKIS